MLINPAGEHEPADQGLIFDDQNDTSAGRFACLGRVLATAHMYKSRTIPIGSGTGPKKPSCAQTAT
jgi:hypothetical protein